MTENHNHEDVSDDTWQELMGSDLMIKKVRLLQCYSVVYASLVPQHL
jgi:hypothetical protein